LGSKFPAAHSKLTRSLPRPCRTVRAAFLASNPANAMKNTTNALPMRVLWLTLALLLSLFAVAVGDASAA